MPTQQSHRVSPILTFQGGGKRGQRIDIFENACKWTRRRSPSLLIVFGKYTTSQRQARQLSRNANPLSPLLFKPSFPYFQKLTEVDEAHEGPHSVTGRRRPGGIYQRSLRETMQKRQRARKTLKRIRLPLSSSSSSDVHGSTPHPVYSRPSSAIGSRWFKSIARGEDCWEKENYNR